MAIAVAGLLLAGVTAQASPPIELSDVAAGTGGFVINGIDAGDVSGQSVSRAGDVNGDGIPDFIIGASGADPIGVYGGTISGAGESYVVFGKTSNTPVALSDVASGNGGFFITGIDLFGQLGYSVSDAGDVNGDGLDDVIVGAPFADQGFIYDVGESYVVFGKTSGTAITIADIAAGNGGFVVNGIDVGDRSGFSVSGAGDVNGDGLDDIIVGAYAAGPNNYSFAGHSYVVFGKTSTSAVALSDIASGFGGFLIDGNADGDFSGSSVSGAGDVNGDGLDDLLVGASGADPGGQNLAGESYVVFGKTTGATVELSAVAAGIGGFVINGIDALDRSGFRASCAGDVNGDGLTDILVGAFQGDPGGSNEAGESYVVFGKASTTTVELSDVAVGIGGFAINGIDVDDQSGRSVNGAGDVNGDGLADIIVGARQGDPGGRADAGECYVVFGKGSTTAVELSDVAAGTGGFILNGIDAGDEVGYSVSDAGDVNGDGLPDLLLGALRADPGGISDAGESYVVFNSEVAPNTATYLGFARAGDGAGGTIVPELEIPDARFAIDFSDEDAADDGSGSASLETITLHRSNTGLSNFPVTPAGVYWEWSTDRVGHTGATVTLKYTDADVSGLGVPENLLRIYTATAASGPWTELPTVVDEDRNQLTVTIGNETGQIFAIGSTNNPVWVDFAHGGTEVGTESLPFDSLGEALLATPPGGEIKLKGDTADNTSGETLVINQAVTLNAIGGTVRIGGAP